MEPNGNNDNKIMTKRNSQTQRKCLRFICSPIISLMIKGIRKQSSGGEPANIYYHFHFEV